MTTDDECLSWTDYRCLGGEVCGADAQYRVVRRYCDGSSFECKGKTDDSAWVPIDNCDENQLCITDESTNAECKTCKHGCGNGACWPECSPMDSCCNPDGTNCQYICYEGNCVVGFSSIGAGFSHTCAVRNNGSIDCWGKDTNDELTPPEGNNFSQVSGGSYHSCGLKDDGKISCWGRNNGGELDSPAGDGFSQISSGYHLGEITILIERTLQYPTSSPK